jgi:glycosyltransferase involved in cell wall biosynthesis
MSMAIPPVVSPVGVNTAIVVDGVNGYLAHDSDAWVAAIGRLVTNPGLRAEMGRRGRKTVVERYSLQSQRDRYAALLDGIIAN